MRQAIFILVLALYGLAPASYGQEIVPEDADKVQLTERDYQRAMEDTGASRFQLRLEFLRARARTPVRAIREDVARDLRGLDRLAFAGRIDSTIDAIVNQTTALMRDKGRPEVADEIMAEYQLQFKGFLTRKMALESSHIGDLEPLSDWLTRVHAKAEEVLGETLCKFFHVHDIFIINYSIKCVFAPADYDLETYQNHFTGERIIGPFWEVYGLAPVVAYWAVNITCMVGTWGAGIVSFVCGPIAGVSENVFGVYLSPPLAKAIWQRAHD